MLCIYLTQWSVQSGDSHKSSPAVATRRLQRSSSLSASGSGAGPWLSRYLPSGSQASPQPSISCHFHAGVMEEGYHWSYLALTCETSQVCQPVDLLQADCAPQCCSHSPYKVLSLVNKSSSPLGGNLELTRAPVVPPSWMHWEHWLNVGDHSGEQPPLPGVSRLEALRVPEHLLVSREVCVPYKSDTMYSWRCSGWAC